MNILEKLKLKLLLESKQGVITHIEHFEDFVLEPTNLEVALKCMTSVFSGKSGTLSTKVDGAPAIYFGLVDNRFFISLKSIANNKPKLMFKPKDIEGYYREDKPKLADKLLLCYEQLKALVNIHSKENIVYHGDVMFTTPDKKTATISKESTVRFKSNTLTYIVKKSDEHYNQVMRADVGVVVHSVYTASKRGRSPIHGLDIEQADSGLLNELQTKAKAINSLFLISGVKTADDVEKHTLPLLKLISTFTEGLSNYNVDVPPNVVAQFKTFVNKQIRENEKNIFTSAESGAKFDTNRFLQEFIEFVSDKTQGKVDMLKTDTGKKRHVQKFESFADEVANNVDKYQQLIELYYKAIQLKLALLNQLDKYEHIIGTTAIESNNGLHETNGEGIVLNDGNTVVKLVDRMVFSKLNFNMDKDW